MKPIRVGVWGVGAWGEKHARVYASVPEARLTGVYDNDAARAAAVATQHGTRAFGSPAELLAASEAVSIAVPTVAHLAAFEQAAAAGIHALVEKPLAPTLAEADAMLEAARRAGTTLQVGHVERFNPALAAAIRKHVVTVADAEPLALELSAFLRSLRGDGHGAASARAGRDALAIAEAVRASMKQRARQWAIPQNAVS